MTELHRILVGDCIEMMRTLPKLRSQQMPSFLAICVKGLRRLLLIQMARRIKALFPDLLLELI